jgi:3-methyladenine DNA glycosylase AlkC
LFSRNEFLKFSPNQNYRIPKFQTENFHLSFPADKEVDDDEEDDAGTSRILDVDDVDDARNAKMPKKKTVDELDILRKQKPRKHSNVYEEWKKQELKMKLEKRKSASKG